jgi:hypothetical protein
MSQSPLSSRSWRKRGRPETSKGVRVAQVTLVFLALGVLTALFVWYVFLGTRSKPYVHAVFVSEYDLTDLPPMEYVSNDIAAMQTYFPDEDGSGDDGKRSFKTSAPDSSGELSNFLAALKRQFEDINPQKDVAIVYIAAHGYSTSEGGFLLGSNSTGSELVDVCKVNELVDDANSIQANTKLFLIDAGRIESDLRNGMAVNEFPYLLHQAVKERGDENLWVICSHSLMQISNVSHDRKRSVFSWAVTEALQKFGKTEETDERDIKLVEFYQSILDHCASYSRLSDTAVQTPLLMRGGHGFVDKTMWDGFDETTRETVLYLSDQIKAIETPEESEKQAAKQLPRQKQQYAAGSLNPGPFSNLAYARGNRNLLGLAVRNEVRLQDEEKDNTANSNLGSEAKQDDTNNATQDEKNSDTAKPITPMQALEKISSAPAFEKMDDKTKLLMRIWLLRDLLQSRNEQLHYLSPVDFAPHLWHRFNQELIALDRLVRADSVNSRGKEDFRIRAERLRKMDASLTSLLTSMMQQSTSSSASSNSFQNDVDIEDQLLTAWNNASSFRETTSETNFRSSDKTNAARLRNAMNNYRDIVFRSRYFVTWYSGHTITSGSNNQGANDRIRNLLQGIRANRAFFEDIGNIGNARVQKISLDKTQAQTIAQAVAASRQLSDLEKQAFNSLKDSLTHAADFRTDQFESEYWLQRLLNSPLVSCMGNPMGSSDSQDFVYSIDRFNVLETLEKTESERSNFTSIPQDWPPSLAPGLAIISSAKRRLGTYAMLLDVSEQSDLDSISLDGQLAAGLSDFRTFGETYQAQLKKYRELADSESSAEKQYQRWRLMSLMDYRDLTNITNYAAPVISFSPSPVVYTYNFAESIPDRIAIDRLDKDGTFQVKIAVDPIPRSTSGMNDVYVEVFEADSDLLVLKHKTFGILERQFPVKLPINGEGIATLEIQVAAREGVDQYSAASQTSPPTFNVLVSDRPKATDDQQKLRKSIAVELPLPDRIDASVRQLNYKENSDFSHAGSSRNSQLIQMRCFPNKESHFQLSLHNRSGRQKQLVAKLWRVELPVSPDSFPAGRIVDPANSKEQVDRDLVSIQRDIQRKLTAGNLLSTSHVVTLGPKGSTSESLALNFSKPPAEKPDTAGGTGGPAASQPQDSGPSLSNANHGLVMTLHEIQGDQPATAARPEYFWLEFERVYADGMITCVPIYDDSNQTLTFQVAARDDLVLDKGLKELVISLESNTKANPYVTIAPMVVYTIDEQLQGVAPELKLQFPPNTNFANKQLVDIAINGAPRELTFEVNKFGVERLSTRAGLTRVKLGEIKAFIRNAEDRNKLDLIDDKEIYQGSVDDSGTAIWGVKQAYEIGMVLHADLPFELPKGEINVNLSEPRNERKLLFDRDVTFGPISIDEAGRLVVKSNVKDHEITFRVGDPKGWATISSQIKSFRGEGSVNASGQDSRRLIFDRANPVFQPPCYFEVADRKFTARGQQDIPVTKGESVVATVDFVDPEIDAENRANGIGIDNDTVEIGLSPKRNDDRAAVKYFSADKQGARYQCSIPTGKLDVQKYYVYLRAKDLLGNTYDEQLDSVTITVSEPVKKEGGAGGNTGGAGDTQNQKPQTFDIAISVKYGINPLSGSAFAKISLEGPKNVNATANAASGSAVQFKGLPPGEYKVVAEGKSNSRKTIKGESTITVGPDNKSFDITVDD